MVNLTAAVLLLLGAAGAAAPAEDKGQELFLKNKCNKCHTIEAKGIAALPKKGGEEDEDDADGEKKKPVDLSKMGAEHDAAFFQGWLKRETEKDGKKHKFKLPKATTDEEVAAIADWLATLK